MKTIRRQFGLLHDSTSAVLAVCDPNASLLANSPDDLNEGRLGCGKVRFERLINDTGLEQEQWLAILERFHSSYDLTDGLPHYAAKIVVTCDR